MPAPFHAFQNLERAIVAHAQFVDTLKLIHDAQLTAAEVPDRAYLGHAAAEYAVNLAERAGAKRLALFHHDQDRTDEEIDEIAGGFARAPVPTFAAAEGQPVDLPG